MGNDRNEEIGAIADLRQRIERHENAVLYNVPVGKVLGNAVLKELRNLDEVTAVSSDPGNALADEYMRGMANGLILAQSIVRGTEPQYIEAPAEPTLQERVNHATADDLPHPDNGAVRPDARR